jgi:hypothetical protein
MDRYRIVAINLLILCLFFDCFINRIQLNIIIILFLISLFFLISSVGVKHIQELVEVNVLDDFSQIYESKITEMVEEITEKILSRLLYDCSNSCDALFNR